MCKCMTAGKTCVGAECWGDVPLATLNLNPDAVSLPKQIVLPLPVANRAHSTRKIALTEATMQLPALIVQYLTEHPTYGAWVLPEAS